MNKYFSPSKRGKKQKPYKIIYSQEDHLDILNISVADEITLQENFEDILIDIFKICNQRNITSI